MEPSKRQGSMCFPLNLPPNEATHERHARVQPKATGSWHWLCITESTDATGACGCGKPGSRILCFSRRIAPVCSTVGTVMLSTTDVVIPATNGFNGPSLVHQWHVSLLRRIIGILPMMDQHPMVAAYTPCPTVANIWERLFGKYPFGGLKGGLKTRPLGLTYMRSPIVAVKSVGLDACLTVRQAREKCQCQQFRTGVLAVVGMLRGCFLFCFVFSFLMDF